MNEDRYATHWYDKKTWRLILTVAFTAVTGILSAFITYKDNIIWIIVFSVLTILAVGLQIVYSSRCAKFDKVRELNVDELEKKISVYRNLFDSLPFLLDTQSEGISKIAQDISKLGIISSDRWSFDKASTQICTSIAQFMKEYGGTSVNVYYVKTVDEDVTKVKMVGCSNYIGDVPNTYMEERNVVNEIGVHFDIKMFAKKSRKAEFRLKYEDVDKVFEYKDREKDAGKIEQFLFIPVSCEKKQMIGLIEITVPKGNKIAETEAEMRNIQKLLKIYSSIFTLLSKSEKAAIALPG